MTKEHSLTWEDIKNWWPFLIAIVSIVFGFSNIITKQAVMDNKLDQILVTLKQMDEKEQRIIVDLNNVHEKLTLLEAIHPNNSHK